MLTESTRSELAKTGIDVIGDVRWGTHICSFYETKDDLLETLVLYFKTGLESKEFCVWVVPQALSVEEARQALGQAVPDLERHLAERMIEIHRPDEWYLRDGRWDAQRVIQSWRDRLSQSSANGHTGLRAAGDGGWVQNGDWMVFREYEKQVSALIADQRSIILCTYPLTTIPGDQVFDVAHAHQVAVARRHGSWEIVETPELRAAKAEIERLNEELEQKVEERTRELAATNEALKRQILERKELEKQARALIDAIPHQIWSGPPDGTTDYCNDRWRSYSGLELEDVQGYGWQTMVHPEDRDRVLNAWHQSVANGTAYEQEERHRGADGKYRWFLARGVPLRDTEGRIERWYGTNTDIEERKRAEEALSKSEKLFAAFMDHLPSFAWMKDVEGRYLYVNKKEMELDAYRVGAIGKTDAELWPPEIAAAYRGNDRQVITTRKAVQTVEPTLIDGKLCHQLVSKFPIFDQDGSVVMVAGAGVDITDLTQARDALNAQALRYKTLMATSTDSIYVLDEKGDLQEANAAFLSRRGYDAAEVQGLNVADWDARLSRDALKERLRRLVGGSAVFETRHRCKDGSIFDVEVCATGVQIDGEQLIFCVARDITERKQVEEALRKSEKLFAAFMDHLPGFAWMKDLEGRHTYVNGLLTQLDPPRGTWVGKADTELWPPEIAAAHRANDETVITTRRAMQLVEPYWRNGEIRHALVSKFPIFAADGAVEMVGGAGIDITDRLVAEQEHAQLAAIVKGSDDAIIGKTLDGVITSWNAAAEKVYGYAASEVIGHSIAILAPPEQRQEIDGILERLRSGESIEHFVTTRRRKDGTKILVSLTISPIRNRRGEIISAATIARDISASKKAEQALRESEQRFRELAENIHEVFWMSDPENTRLIYISPAYETIWGRSREALYDSPASWLEAIHPEDKERIIHTRMHRASAIPHESTYRIVRPDGSVRWIRDRGFPVHDEQGAVVRFAGIAEDITEHKLAEERLQEYEKVVEGLEEMIVVVDRDYRYLLANRAFLKYRGLEREQLIGRLAADVLNPEAFDQVADKLSECLAGKTIQYEMRYAYPDRGERDVLVSYFPIEGPGGIDRVACVLQDITERKRTEQARERGLSLMLATLESTADGILVVNTEGKIETFNRLFAQMWRLPDEVLASKEDARALKWVLDQLVEPEKFLEKISYLYRHPEAESFDRLVFKDGRVFERYSRPQLIAEKVAGRVWSFRDVTERRQAAKALEEANRQLRVLSRQLFHIQEEERRHLARELHDEIGQTLTAAKINLKIIAPDVPAKVTGRLDDSVQLLDRLLRQVRELSLDLRPPLLDELGLVPTLRWLVDQQAQRAGLRVTFTANVDGLEINPDIQTACFRVAQEAITNTIRHSAAKNVAVELRREAERLTLRVCDDGAGFDPAVIQRRTTQDFTLGLVSMKERALLVRGGFEVQSTPGQGTEIRAWFPLASGEHLSPGTA